MNVRGLRQSHESAALGEELSCNSFIWQDEIPS